MKWLRWFKWLGVYLGAFALLAGVGYAIYALTELNTLATMRGRTAVGVMGAFLIAWCVRGLVLWVKGEAGRVSSFVQLSVITFLLLPGFAGVYLAITGKLASESDFGVILAGIWGLTWLFVLLLEGLRWVLSRGGGVPSVARTVLDEAIRMKIAVAFIALLLVVLPILPFTLSDEAPLRYRVQTFLTYSLTATNVLLCMMTVLLACATLSWEIEGKQIFTVAVKPLGRGAYLFGKWLGIILLDALLLVIAGLAIYGFAVFYLARLPAQDDADRQRLEREVLTARISASAQPPRPFAELARERVEQVEREAPQQIEEVGRDQARGMGLVEPPPERIMELGRIVMTNQLTEEIEKEWRIIHPGEVGRFVFEGLGGAQEYARTFAQRQGRQATVQFLYKADASGNVPNDQIGVLFRFNGRPPEGVAVTLVINSAQTFQVPAEWIGEDGRLTVEVANVVPGDPQARRDVSLTFSSRDQMQVLYHKGEFAPNFLRGMLALWAKLAFLAMLGLAAATFLGFPVAVVFSLLVTVAAMSSPYLLDSVRSFGNNPQDFVGYITMILKWVGWSVATLLQQFAAYKPTPLIVDGREFSWWELGKCVLWVGFVWTALTGAIGWGIYRNRELARVQV